MEPIQTRKTVILLIVAVLLVGVAALAFFRFSPKAPVTTVQQTVAMRLGQLVSNDLPVLDLDLQFISTRGQEIPAEETKLGKPGTIAKAQAAPIKVCPELIGGDTDSRIAKEDSEKRDENCAKSARWIVKRHPIGFSLYFQDGKEVLSLFDDKTKVGELFQNRFFQGIFHEPLRDFAIRAEDLRLQGLEGAVLRTLIREAVVADAELHYDVAHGKRGFVFSFVREKCGYLSTALPVMARVLGRSGYRIPALPELILEMRIGLQRLFLTEAAGRIYLANGLETLINVLESLPAINKDRRQNAIGTRGTIRGLCHQYITGNDWCTGMGTAPWV